MSKKPKLSYHIEEIPYDNVVKDFIEKYHIYQSSPKVSIYTFVVKELNQIVAAYVWNVPSQSSARAVNPYAPHGTLSLSLSLSLTDGCRTKIREKTQSCLKTS